MRYIRLAVLAALVAMGLMPVISANAQDDGEGRVKASQLVKSVVLINTFSCEQQPVVGQAVPLPYQELACDPAPWKGSGAVIDHQGRILTNDHVVRPDRHGSGVDPNRLGWYLVYQTLDAKELPVAIYYARIVASDPNLDLAILEPAWGLDGQPLASGAFAGAIPSLPMAADAGTVEIEDALRLLGYPRAHKLVTVSNVNVVGFDEDGRIPTLGTTAWIRTDVGSAGPGNSGGPAVNDDGEQIGVVSAGSRNILECQDYNGDGQEDLSECQAAAGGVEYIRPIPEAFVLLQQDEPTAEPSPSPTPEAPPEPPEESPTSEVPEPPAEPTATTEAPEPPDPTEATGTAIIIGTLVSADTGDPIPRAQVVVLVPGVSVKDWKRGEVGSEAIFTWTLTDDRGNFQLPDPVQRGVGYGIWLQAAGFEELFKDDKVLATDDDPAIVDLGTIRMPAQV